MRTTRWMRLSLAAVAIVGLTAACGDDDDDARSGSASGSAASEGGGAAELAAFCDGYFELNSGEPTAAQVREVAADAPEAAKEPLEAIAAGFDESGDDYTDTDEFGEHYEAVTGVVADECADDSISVTASEYAFAGIPSTVDAGVLAVEFDNAGKEMHEIIVLRKKDGVDESFEDILAKGEEEAQKLVDISFGAFGPPGSTSTAVFDMSDAGDYAAVCFIPVGSTPEAGEGAEGPPHFTQGMKTEFTVG